MLFHAMMEFCLDLLRSKFDLGNGPFYNANHNPHPNPDSDVKQSTTVNATSLNLSPSHLNDWPPMKGSSKRTS